MKPISGENQPVIASYLTGFVLALSLTLLAFGLVIVGRGGSLGPIDKVLGIFPYGEVITGKMPRHLIIVGVFVLAILQISVHLRYFLHLSFGSPQNWNLLAILFALFIIIIMVGGTLWIMNDLNGHMLLGSPVGAVHQ